MGMGCTEEGCEKTKHHIVEEMGLQAGPAVNITTVLQLLYSTLHLNAKK